MTDLVPREPHSTTPMKRRIGGLPNIERHLDLDRTITAAMIGVGPGPCWPEPLDDWNTRAEAVERVQGHARWLDTTIAGQMPASSVRRCLDLLNEALTARPDRKVTMAAVGLLVGSRARQPSDPEVFIQTLEFDLVDLGFSPTVVVLALQRLRREQVFTPEIAEVIKACETERSRFRLMRDRAERAARYRVGLENARADIPELMAEAQARPDERPGGLWS